jgi:hypothetical protein
MPGICVTFGYYPHLCDTRIGDISVTTLTGLKKIVDDIEGSKSIEKDWLYVPARMGQPHRIFGLPKTHVLTHENADSLDHVEFLVWCFSFFIGMRLTTTEAGFVDATPIKPGTLTDFSLSRGKLRDALFLAESFWQKHHHNQRDVKLVMGIIHALFLSQYPPYLQFEEFTYLYIALDACYALAKSICGAPPNLSHGKRIEWMCQQFNAPVPDWAASDGPAGTVSAVRNNTLHEALFFEEPLGFAIYGGNDPLARNDNVPLQMGALTCRLLVALLGKPNCYYVTTPVTTRGIFDLDLT